MSRDEFENLVKDYAQAVIHRETALDWADYVERAEAIRVGALQRVMAAWDALQAENAQLVDSAAALNKHYTSLIDELQADNARQANELATLRTLVSNVLHHNSAPAIIERDGVVRELREEIAAYREALGEYADGTNWDRLDRWQPMSLNGSDIARAALAKFAKEQP